jgi:hypothetical protein
MGNVAHEVFSVGADEELEGSTQLKMHAEEGPVMRGDTYVDFRIQEWRMGEQSLSLQASVRKVLTELDDEALLCLRAERLEVRAVAGSWHHSVWAYFPIWPRWIKAAQEMAASGITFNREIASQMTVQVLAERAYGNAHAVRQADELERVRIVRELLPRSATRVLLVFGVANFERDKRKHFEDCLRDHLGHVLLYLRDPKANNHCPGAMKEWRRSITEKTKAASAKAERTVRAKKAAKSTKLD